MKHPKLAKENHGLKQIRKEKHMGKLGLPIMSTSIFWPHPMVVHT